MPENQVTILLQNTGVSQRRQFPNSSSICSSSILVTYDLAQGSSIEDHSQSWILSLSNDIKNINSAAVIFVRPNASNCKNKFDRSFSIRLELNIKCALLPRHQLATKSQNEACATFRLTVNMLKAILLDIFPCVMLQGLYMRCKPVVVCGAVTQKGVTGGQAETTQLSVQRTSSRRKRRRKRTRHKRPAVQESHTDTSPMGNTNLSPLAKLARLGLVAVDTWPSVMRVSEQIDPWIEWTLSWSSATIYQTRMRMQANGNPSSAVFVNMMTPALLSSPLKPISLFWDEETVFTLDFVESGKVSAASVDALETIAQITALYLQALKPQSQYIDQRFAVLFSPDQPHNTLDHWLSENSGSEPAIQAHARGTGNDGIGVVYDCTNYNERLIFKRWVYSQNGTIPVLKLECEQASHRRQPLCGSFKSNEKLPPGPARVRVLPAEACTVSNLPFAQSIFGLFIPAIFDILEKQLVAERLCSTVLSDVGFKSVNHVVTALTTPFTRSQAHYQRYEFFGDSILKYMVSCQLFFEYRDWQEHDLTIGRDELVQNPRLTQAAVRIGLDAFVIDRRLNVRKWSAPSISQEAQTGSKKRDLGAKVLADVVEALIGAAYVDGGPSRAQACIRRLLPEARLQPLSIQSTVKTVTNICSEDMIEEGLKRGLGYTFMNESLLLEALTHPSCGHQTTTPSYQRLEFLGDAVLDMVIVDHFIRTPVEIPQGEMTLIKHAVSNASLLAFFCLDFTVYKSRSNVRGNIDSNLAQATSKEACGLWRFMRFMNPSLKFSQDAVFKRYWSLRNQIAFRIEQANQYPWQELCELNADKYFSDVVESILGAIFVDSGGDLSACEVFLERIGLLRYFRRILVDSVSVAHPKNIVQMLSKSLARFSLKRFDNGDSDATYGCAVNIHGTEIALVEGCLCRAEAEVKAANIAIESLTHTPLDMLIPSKACL